MIVPLPAHPPISLVPHPQCVPVGAWGSTAPDLRVLSTSFPRGSTLRSSPATHGGRGMAGRGRYGGRSTGGPPPYVAPARSPLLTHRPGIALVAPGRWPPA